MAIRYYDEALANKIKAWVIDSSVTILKPDEVSRLFQTVADKKNDKPIALPLIALSREPELEILSTNKKALSYDGAKLNANEQKANQLNAIPIEIHYQLDIYTRLYTEADEYLRNFIFNFINFPRLSIVIPYNGANIKHDSNVRILSTVTDNSDVKMSLAPGQFTRWTIKLMIDDAYLFSIPFQSVKTMSDTNPVETPNDKSM